MGISGPKNISPIKIGILGGTFDPIHLGHLQLAENARTQFSLDKVLLIPAYDPPHKKKSAPLASAQDRYEMVRLAIEGRPGLEISNCEIKRRGASYTIDTLKELEKQYAAAQFYLILGHDAFLQVDLWRGVEEIKKKVQFLVAKREPTHFPNFSNTPAAWISMPLCPISSSGIREAVKRRRNVDDDLPQKVWQYIHAHGLYQKK